MSDVMYDERDKMEKGQKEAFGQALDRCQPLPRGQMADIAMRCCFWHRICQPILRDSAFWQTEEPELRPMISIRHFEGTEWSRR